MPSFNTNGWIYHPDAIDELSSVPNGMFCDAAPNLKGIGKGKTVLLYKNYDKVGIKMKSINQGNVGSCVAAALAGLTDNAKVTEIVGGEREEFLGQTAIEHIYRIARLNSNIRGDGASTAEAVKAMTILGTLVRMKYPEVDLTKYSVDRCRKWGNNQDYPKSLDKIAKQHKFINYTRLRSYEEVRDAIASGYCVAIGSSYGFNSTCDKNGFAKQDTTWNHCMYWSAIRSDIEGVLTQNSWDAWNVMPVRKFDEPVGSFWCRPEDCDKMASRGDCWALSNFEGFPKLIDSSVAW